MEPETYRVRIEGMRFIVAVVSDTTRERIDERLKQLNASSVGPSAWLCAIETAVDKIVAAIGELADGEVVYLAAQGTELLDFSFVVLPNTAGGIVVSSC